MSQNSKGMAVVTGASSGIGAVYADRLAKRGYDLILVARNAARLDALAGRLRASTGRHVSVIAADLNDRADLGRIETLLREHKTITVLVNNAGVAAVTPLLGSDVDKMEAMVDLNVVALTRLTYAAVPGFVAHGSGTIINISSVVGIVPEVINGVYAASKAYVLALSQSLHHELADKGVRVQAVLPGATATELWEIAGYPHENMPKETVMSAEDLVDAALIGLDRGEFVSIPPLQDETQWTAYETARRAMLGKLSNAAPAPRYRVAELAH
jgi:uncharacterized protein